MEDDYIPQDGDLADGPNGQVMLFRAGAWHPADAEGRPTGRIPRPDYGDRYYELPNGDIVREGPQGGIEVIERGGAASSGGPDTALVGADARARFMLGLGPLIDAQGIMERMEAEGYTRDQDPLANMAEAIPWDGGWAGRAVGGDDYTAYMQAVKTFEAAILPVMSGAAVTPTEAQRQVRATLPQPGDTPEVLAQKARQRQMMINAIAQGIGQEVPFPGVGIWGPDGEQGDDPQAMAAGGPASGAGPSLPTLPGFGGGDGTEPPGSENNPYDYDALDLNQRQALPPGSHIASRNEDGTYRLSQYVRAGFAEEPPEGAVERPDGTFEVSRDAALGRTGAYVSGAAEQLPFVDEASRVIVGLLTGDGYDAVTEFDRQQDEIDRNVFGGFRNAGGVTGGVMGLLLPGGSIMNGTRGLNAFARGAGIGAGYGAVYGAGAAEDGERLAGARDGAIVGGLTGGLAEPIGGVVGSIGTAAGRTVDGWTGGRIGELLSSATGGRVGGAQNGARARMMDALRRDGFDGPRLQGLMDQWQANGGTDAALIDLVTQNGGGQNFMSLVRASALRGGGASGAAQRYRGQVEGGAADNAINLTRGLTPDQRSVPQATDDLRRARSDQAEADYAGPYAVRGGAPRDVLDALQGRAGQSAMRRAYRAAEARRDAAQMQDIQALLDWRPGQPSPQVSAGAVDRVRIAFGEAGDSLNRDGGRDIAAGLFDRARQIDEVLEEVPDLAPARQAYRDNTQRIQGLEMGQGAYSRSPDDIAAQLGAAPAARDTFGLGMARDIEGAIGRQGDGSTGLFNRLSSAPNATNALAQGFGPERAGQYQNALGQIVDRVRTARAIDPGFGSQTAQRGMDALIEGVAPISGGLIAGVVRKLREGLALTDAEREIIVRYATSLPDNLNAVAPRDRQRALPRPLLGAQAGMATQ
jgi:hypothetical protein